jgi:hypothetical protein
MVPNDVRTADKVALHHVAVQTLSVSPLPPHQRFWPIQGLQIMELFSAQTYTWIFVFIIIIIIKVLLNVL